jgi:Na+/H+ antiporter NhaA
MTPTASAFDVVLAVVAFIGTVVWVWGGVYSVRVFVPFVETRRDEIQRDFFARKKTLTGGYVGALGGVVAALAAFAFFADQNPSPLSGRAITWAEVVAIVFAVGMITGLVSNRKSLAVLRALELEALETGGDMEAAAGAVIGRGRHSAKSVELALRFRRDNEAEMRRG